MLLISLVAILALARRWWPSSWPAAALWAVLLVVGGEFGALVWAACLIGGLRWWRPQLAAVAIVVVGAVASGVVGYVDGSAQIWTYGYPGPQTPSKWAAAPGKSWGCAPDAVRGELVMVPHNAAVEGLGAVFGPLPGGWQGRRLRGDAGDAALLKAATWKGPAAVGERLCGGVRSVEEGDVVVGDLDGAVLAGTVVVDEPELCILRVQQCHPRSGALLSRPQRVGVDGPCPR